MQNILNRIVADKQSEIAQLYQQYALDDLKKQASPTQGNFYQAIEAAQKAQKPFFICEFKRKSPSEGWIDQHARLPEQVLGYARAGAGAISVLTDGPYFGGHYDDLRLAAATLSEQGEHPRPLLLQKDFILDEIQIYLARIAGADLILLIAAILPPARLEALQSVAESLGMGVLVEVHDQEELDAVQHLHFPVLGINNRDLKVFRTSLNRVNVLRRQSPQRCIVAESGVQDYRDFKVVRQSDGFLIGTGLMRQGPAALTDLQRPQPLFKACGIRTSDHLHLEGADFIGFNFSPLSKRRIDPTLLDARALPAHAVAVFYQNSEREILDLLEKYPFQRVQLYAGDVSPAFVRSIRKKVILAARIRTAADIEDLEAYAADIDFFILDGPVPGSGTPVDTAVIPPDFPYPFLLAGGLHVDNLEQIRAFPQCIGVDIASGIETDGQVDLQKITAISRKLAAITK